MSMILLSLRERLSKLIWKDKDPAMFAKSNAPFIPNDHWPDGPNTESWHDATLVLSKLREGEDMHWPVLDLDMSCHLIPSSTEGHFHLVIEKPMKWDHYEELLRTMNDFGLLETGYVDVARKRKYTTIRRPGVTKEKTNDNS